LTKTKLFSALTILAALAGFVLMAGCGTIDINLETDFEPNGDFTQSLVYTATGEIGAALAESAGGLPDVQDGWQLNLEITGDETTLTATRSFEQGEAFNFPDSEGDTPPQITFESSGFLIFTDYRFQAAIPPGSSMGVSDEEIDELGSGVLSSLFNISWTVNMPGEITESDADEIEGGSATWDLDFETLSTGLVLNAESRVMNWAVIAGGGTALLVAVGLLIFFLVRRRA
jgi:hypothetical protein